MAEPLDLAAEIDLLYSGNLTGFVAQRDALVKRLRASGDRQEARRIKGLLKPSLSAWAVNQLSRRAAAPFEELLDLGEELRRLQVDGGTPGELHRASRRRRVLVQQLLAYAERLLDAAGHAAGSATLQRVHGNLEALAGHGRSPDAPQPGRLTDDLEAAGFDRFQGVTIATAAVVAPASPRGRPDPRPSAASTPSPPAGPEPDPRRSAAEAELAAASDDARRAAEAADGAQRELATAEERERQARTALDSARSIVAAAARRLDAERQRAAAAEAALEEADALAHTAALHSAAVEETRRAAEQRVTEAAGALAVLDGAARRSRHADR